jgi:HD-GYP domain-containing protein (c-di-GMP phosphodiesterase class II)
LTVQSTQEITSETLPATGTETLAVRTARSPVPSELVDRLRRAFDVPVAVLDLSTGKLDRGLGDWLAIDHSAWLGLLDEVARRGRVEFVEDCAPLAVLAVPVHAEGEEWCTRLALATFVTEPVDASTDVSAAAAAVRLHADVLHRWAMRQPVWPTRAIAALGQNLVDLGAAQSQNQKLKQQLTNVSHHLLQTFDELNLLHRINERLSLTSDAGQLIDLAVEWLGDVLPAECVLACMASETDDQPDWIYTGRCPIPAGDLAAMFGHLGPEARDSTVLLDRDMTATPAWQYPTIREAISVPIRAGSEIAGWLLAVNHRPTIGRETNEFGTLETSLLSSVASMLGMHAGNVRQYKDQTNFFESVVRAFSSAIDAKDPYTCGHSERVARISVLLAKTLKCSHEEVTSIYWAGLLHDIGKIGVDDQVLRKPSALTPKEFEHIKRHPELGYHILKGVRQLEHVLPVVLHHHEAWDGSGYPGRLRGEAIPWHARIVAVADSFDAMTSDRPYRAGMPAEKLDDIFRSEAARQWDPRVIEAFFAVRDEIRQVVEIDRQTRSYATPKPSTPSME